MLELGNVTAVITGLIVLVVVLYSAYLVLSSRTKAENMRKFRQDLSQTYSDYQTAYKVAKATLSKEWDVIEVIHDVSDYNLGPAGLPTEITFEQAFEIVRQIRAARNAPIAIVIHTMGGFSMPTDMIAKALGQHKGKKVAFVPYAAMSGGTVIALAAEEIAMGTAAALGPIDTQYWGFPASAFEFLTQKKHPDRIDDRALMIAHVVEKFEAGAPERARARIHPNHTQSVAKELIDGGRHHGESISAAEAKEMGINISKKDFPKSVYTLVDTKLGMVAKDRERIVRGALDLPTTQVVGRSQLWWHRI